MNKVFQTNLRYTVLVQVEGDAFFLFLLIEKSELVRIVRELHSDKRLSANEPIKKLPDRINPTCLSVLSMCGWVIGVHL